MEIDTATLPDAPGDLKEIIIGLQGQITDLHEAHNKETGILIEQIRHLRAVEKMIYPKFTSGEMLKNHFSRPLSL